MFTWDSFENHWDLLIRECVRRREKTQMLTTNKTFMKLHIAQQKNISYVVVSVATDQIDKHSVRGFSKLLAPNDYTNKFEKLGKNCK